MSITRVPEIGADKPRHESSACPIRCQKLRCVRNRYNNGFLVTVLAPISGIGLPCGRLSWLPVSFLLHVKYSLSYRIVCHGH